MKLKVKEILVVLFRSSWFVYNTYPGGKSGWSLVTLHMQPWNQTHQSFPSVQLKLTKFITSTSSIHFSSLYTPCCCQLFLHYNPKRISFISFPSFNIYKLPPPKNLSSNHYMIYPSHPYQTMTKTVRKGGKVESNQPKTITKETGKERDDGKGLL
jgi:hypothetical protein